MTGRKRSLKRTKRRKIKRYTARKKEKKRKKRTEKNIWTIRKRWREN